MLRTWHLGGGKFTNARQVLLHSMSDNFSFSTSMLDLHL